MKIGDLMPLTGALSPYGPSFIAATELATKYANQQLAADGLSNSYSVEITDTQDEQSAATPAVEGATKLVEVDGVNMIDGPLDSGAAIAVAQSVTLPKEVLLVSPTASSNALSKLGGNLIFRFLPPNAYIAKELVASVQEEVGADATVNVGWTNDQAFSEIGEEFTSLWEQAGGTVGETVTWNQEASTFDTEAQQLVAGDPDAIVLSIVPTIFEKLGPALVRTGKWSPSSTFVGPEMRDPASVKQLGPELTTGLRGVSPAMGKTSQQENFEALFKKEEPGKTATGYETYVFDSVVVPFLAALAAGSNEPHAIAGEMEAVTNKPGKVYTYETLGAAIKAVLAGEDIDYHGVSGPLALGPEGVPTEGPFDVWEAQPNGDVKTVKTFNELP